MHIIELEEHRTEIRHIRRELRQQQALHVRQVASSAGQIRRLGRIIMSCYGIMSLHVIHVIMLHHVMFMSCPYHDLMVM